MAGKWLSVLKEEDNKHDIVAALRVRGEPRTMGPDEKPETPEDLAAKTAKTPITPETEDEKPEMLINSAAKTTEAERLCPIATWSAEFGYVRPA